MVLTGGHTEMAEVCERARKWLSFRKRYSKKGALSNQTSWLIITGRQLVQVS